MQRKQKRLCDRDIVFIDILGCIIREIVLILSGKMDEQTTRSCVLRTWYKLQVSTSLFLLAGKLFSLIITINTQWKISVCLLNSLYACVRRQGVCISFACVPRQGATFVVLHRFSGGRENGLVFKIHSRPDPHLCTVLGAVSQSLSWARRPLRLCGLTVTLFSSLVFVS